MAIEQPIPLTNRITGVVLMPVSSSLKNKKANNNKQSVAVRNKIQ